MIKQQDTHKKHSSKQYLFFVFFCPWKDIVFDYKENAKIKITRRFSTQKYLYSECQKRWNTQRWFFCLESV